MTKRLTLNIRGANAAGKTTLMRKFLANPTEPVEVIEKRAPDGTKVHFQLSSVTGLSRPVVIIGKYDDSKYSGCDKIKSADAIEWAVQHALEAWPTHHVLFEGFRVSKSYSRFADLRNRLSGAGETYLWAFLHATHDLICERSEGRREANSRPIDREELGRVVKQMDKTRRTVLQLWPDEAITLHPSDTPDTVYANLIEWLADKEAA